ncbi:hypothetical protein HDU85_001027, partial [Gaertneriomyces sp. JEL0708]
MNIANNGQGPPLPLTEDNWLVWSSLFEAKMVIIDLGHMLNDERTDEDFPNRLVHVRSRVQYQEWLSANQKCLAHLKLNVGITFLSEVTQAKTAFQAWSNLRKRVNSLSQLGTTALYSKIYNTKKSPEDSIRKHLDGMNGNRQLLASLGNQHTISDIQWLNIVVNSIPATKEFETTLITLSRSITSGQVTIDDITNQLVEAERIHEQAKQAETAMVSTLPSSGRKVTKKRKTGDASRGSRVPCEFCDKTNHQPEVCWMKPGNEHLRPNWLREQLSQGGNTVAQNGNKRRTITMANSNSS